MVRMLLLAARGAEAERFAERCREAFTDVSAFHGDWGTPLPPELGDWSGDVILSYCSRWIAPHWLLDRAALALNFHPAPPEYPGIGGLNWALYQGADTFGVTCHHMAATVDTGPIVEVKRFPVLAHDDVAALFDRIHLHLEALAESLILKIAQGWAAPSVDEGWSGVTRTRHELNAMMNVPPDATAAEVARRKRAFEFRGWKLRGAAMRTEAGGPLSAH